ncbi:GAF domain-containing protein [Gordonia amicalis]|uniref:DUF5593 domain-containing protein n=1 Tax=Gordonia amicalis TaxID=89053 RepID=A0ABU4DL18_9ACTN|nr:GAF domain-containing protein [Gordonia amicalis]MDV6309979.1 DUF5593 domain-containing protein [Gordonia amicalis]
MSWYLIETLCPPAYSIVFIDGTEHAWSSVLRIARKDGVDSIVDLIEQVLRTREGLDRNVVGHKGARRVVMRPVLGYEGEVYGIKTWVAPSETPIAPEEKLSRPVDRGVSGDLRSGALVTV